MKLESDDCTEIRLSVRADSDKCRTRLEEIRLLPIAVKLLTASGTDGNHEGSQIDSRSGNGSFPGGRGDGNSFVCLFVCFCALQQVRRTMQHNH